MAEEIAEQAKRSRRPRFWVAPLLVGSCFSLGFGITQRVAMLQSNARTAEPETFAAKDFPGRSLNSLRQSLGDRSSLQVDVAAIEAIEAAERESESKEEAALALNSGPLPEAVAIQEPVASPEQEPALAFPPSTDEATSPNPQLDLMASPLLQPTPPVDPLFTDNFFVPVLPEEPPLPAP